MSNWREREAWRARALCFGEDLNLWFPDNFQDAKEAKVICYGCPVRRDCLLYALQTHTREGVWGGFYGAEIPKKGRKFLDHPEEFIKGRKPSHLRVAANGRILSQRHDHPQRTQQTSARRLGGETCSDLRRERAAEACDIVDRTSCG